MESIVFRAARCRCVLGLLLTVTFLAVAPPASAAEPRQHITHKPVQVFPSIIGPACRPLDQIFLVSSRRLGCPSSCTVSDPNLQYLQYVDGCWTASSLDALLATDQSAVATSIYVHGNQVTAEQARSMGLSAYRQMVKWATDDAPLRFIIWSWPSERSHGILRDARVKAARANGEGYYVAWLIDRMQPDVKITLLGYSLGARIATGTLHVLGGGQVAGVGLPARVHPQRTPLKAVLMAAAVDNDWLLPGHTHGLALTQIDQLLIIKNSCDRVLRSYRLIAPDRPVALGYSGLPMTASLAPHWHKIKQVNICDRRHDWTSYLFSPRLVDLIQPLAFWDWPVLTGT